MTWERRIHPRAIVGLPAQIQEVGGDSWDDVFLYDLSACGAAVHAERAVPIRTEVRLRFLLPRAQDAEDTQITITCLVVRSGTPSQPRFAPAFMIGLHFLDLVAEDFDRVRVFVWNSVQRQAG